MTEAVNTAVETNNEVVGSTETDNAQVQGQEAQGKGSAPKVTSSDQKQLDAVQQLIDSQQLPPEVKCFKDKSGKLMFTMPIDGKMRTVDFTGLVKGFNLNQVGYERLEQAKSTEKKFESFISNLKENPDELWAFAERVGLDPIKLAQGRLQKAVD